MSMSGQQNIYELQVSLEKELNFSFAHEAYDQWLNALELWVNDLILNDVDKLVFVLYRLDIDEQKLRSLLKDNTALAAARIITHLIIERQLQKMATRNQYRKPNTDIAEDEKW